MNRINKYNYEAFFLDYWENRLSDEQKAELEKFLEDNPGLRLEFESFEEYTYVAPLNVGHPNTEKLKSGVIQASGEINSGNYEDYLIAASEDDLNTDQQHQLEIFLFHNPVLEQELNLYRQSRITPDQDIVFDGRQSLYIKTIPFFSQANLYRIAAVAALFIIAFGIYRAFFYPSTPSELLNQRDHFAFNMEKKGIRHISFKTDLNIYNNPPPQLYAINRFEPQRSGNIAMMQPIESPAGIELDDSNYSYSGLLSPILPPGLIIQKYLIEQQEIMLAENAAKDKTLFGKIIDGLFKNVSDRVQPRQEAIEEIKPRKGTFWDLAESGIEGYNYLTNNDVILVRTIDKEGRTKKVRFLRDNELVLISGDQ